MRKFRFALLGFLNGYVLLHPVSMGLYVSLETHGNPVSNPMALLSIFLRAFSSAMLPMSLGFGLLGVVVSLVYERQSSRLSRERTRLHWEVERGAALVEELQYRTRQLTAQKHKLIDLQRMRERTIGYLVHDFKNQLGCIKGFSEILLDQQVIKDQPDSHTLLVRIHRQAGAMIVGVRNLLDITRLEETPVLRRESLDPGILLHSIAYEDYAAPGNYEIILTPETGNCPPVFVERDLIRRVILNLVGNAIKHQGPGVRITLGATPDPSGECVVFSCRDNGKPIPTEVQALMFTAHRVGRETVDDSTGLGLAFARAAIEAHGGRIWFDGSETGGNCFCFTLPTERNTEMPDKKQQMVLVVDDEPDFAALLESMIRGFGFEVRSAHSAEGALAEMAAHPPNLITLDVQMPDKSGLLFYRQIKNRNRWRDVPVIVISGLPAQDPEWRGFMKAFLEVDSVPSPRAYLDKPVSRDVLETTIKSVLGEDAIRT